MRLHLLGLPPTVDPWRQLNRIPDSGGKELAELIRSSLPPEFNQSQLWLDNQDLENFSPEAITSQIRNGVLAIVVDREDASSMDQDPGHSANIILATAAGPDSGRLFSLKRETIEIGRFGSDFQIMDPLLSAHDFSLSISAHGVTIEEPATKSSKIWVGMEDYQSGQTSFRLVRGLAESLLPPREPRSPIINAGREPNRPNLAIQIITSASPLLIGTVMVILTGRWYFLLFSLMSILIAGAIVIQHSRAKNKFTKKIELALGAYIQEIESTQHTPLAYALAARSEKPDRFGTTMNTQPGHPVVCWGRGTQEIEIDKVQDQDRWNRARTGRMLIPISLLPGQSTLIRGEPTHLRPLLDWVKLQLLRHCRSTASQLIVINANGVDSFGAAEPELTIIIDLTGEEPDQRVTAGGPKHVITITTDVTKPLQPSDQETVVDLIHSQIRGPNLVVENFTADGVSARNFHRLLAELAPGQGTSLSTEHLMQFPLPLMTQSSEDELRSDIGAGPLGTSFDLVRQGPHFLITGTTGSGKSELLLTLLTSLVAHYPPSEVALILLDFKGGASFSVLSGLAHTMHMETNHIGSASLRSLDAIEAELQRRQRLFLEYNVPDYTNFRRSYPRIILPRLIVSIDELRVLVDEHPEALALLERLAATGRSLGFHLVLATQRAQGSVSSDIRSNIGTVLCLRTATEQESWELLGSNIAHSISTLHPGQGYYKIGAEEAQLFQTGRFAIPEEQARLSPVSPDVQKGSAIKARSIASWSVLSSYLHHHVVKQELAHPTPVVLPALPEHVEIELPSAKGIPLGLVDAPHQQRQYNLSWSWSATSQSLDQIHSSIAWIGTEEGGLSQIAHATFHNLMEYQNALTKKAHLITYVFDTADNCLPNTDVTRLSPTISTEELTSVVSDIQERLIAGHPILIMIKNWGQWAPLRVGSQFESVEDCLIRLKRDNAYSLKLLLFGGRELAGGRVLGLVNHRFYIPRGTTIEHRLVWPRLRAVEEIRGRAIFVSPDLHPSGLAIQLQGI